MKRTFVETKLFEKLIDQENDSSLESEVKSILLEDPKRGDIIQGTGGVRKVRIADKGRGKGKRGGYRVLYLDLPQKERTYLLLIYDKDNLDNISPSQKNKLKRIVTEIKNEK